MTEEWASTTTWSKCKTSELVANGPRSVEFKTIRSVEFLTLKTAGNTSSASEPVTVKERASLWQRRKKLSLRIPGVGGVFINYLIVVERLGFISNCVLCEWKPRQCHWCSYHTIFSLVGTSIVFDIESHFDLLRLTSKIGFCIDVLTHHNHCSNFYFVHFCVCFVHSE